MIIGIIMEDELNENLILAAETGSFHDVQTLLNNGANPSYRNTKTALIAATRTGHLEVVELLLANNADVNTLDSRGMTALMAACQFGRRNILFALLMRPGLNLNIVDPYFHKTAIGWARWNRYLGIVDDLNNAGAAVRPQDQEVNLAIPLWTTPFVAPVVDLYVPTVACRILRSDLAKQFPNGDTFRWEPFEDGDYVCLNADDNCIFRINDIVGWWRLGHTTNPLTNLHITQNDIERITYVCSLTAG